MKTTQEAFAELLNSPQAAEKMGIKQEQIYVLRNRLSKGKVSIDKMEKHLTKAGYQVAQEKMWLTVDDVFEKHKTFHHNINKNKPSFSPGGTITNSTTEVILPKEYLKEKNMDAYKPKAKQQP